MLDDGKIGVGFQRKAGQVVLPRKRGGVVLPCFGQGGFAVDKAGGADVLGNVGQGDAVSAKGALVVSKVRSHSRKILFF